MTTTGLFLDDSGKESGPGNPYVCMAGYFGTEEASQSLNENWHQLLLKHGLRELHMKELFSADSKECRRLGWDATKRDSVLLEFVAAIRRSNLAGVGVAVDVVAWAAAKKRHPKESWSNAQQWCLERILRIVVDRLHQTVEHPMLRLVFDTDRECGSNRVNLFQNLITLDPWARQQLAAITFGFPRCFPLLQAADLLVWETRREMINRTEGKKSTKRWNALLAQVPEYHLDQTGELWDEARFLKFGLTLLQPHHERVAGQAGFFAARSRK